MEAVVPGFDRTDSKYLTFLEDEYVRNKRQQERVKNEDDEGTTGAEMSQVLDSLRDITSCLGDIKADSKSLHDKIDSAKQPMAGGGNRNPTPLPADLLTAPLTQALAKLLASEDDPCILLRPETYAQADLKEKNRDHNKLDLIDLL